MCKSVGCRIRSYCERSKQRRGDRCSPLLGAYVTGMLGKEPAMTVQVLDAVLFFPVDRHVKFLTYGRSQLAGFRVVSVDVGDHDGQRLRVVSEDRRALGSLARAGDHDDRGSQEHLNSAHRLAVAEVLFEAEDSGEPVARLGNVTVNKMRKRG